MTQQTTTSVSETFAPLYEKLGYTFQNRALLAQALRHRSLGKDNNERLEFLGDALLSSIVAHALYIRYPDWNEGQLSRIRASLVNQAQLAEIAYQLHLYDYVEIGESEKRNHGEQRPSLLSDTLEAILAAIFLDSDFTNCQRLVLSWYGERLTIESAAAHVRDAKSKLQELLQKIGRKLARYQVVKINGPDHKQIFTVSCNLENPSQQCQGTGSNKRLAEQAAAAEMLKLLEKTVL